MKKVLLLGPLALFTGAGALTATPPPDAWEIGPVIRGKNYSVNMPLRPTPLRQGWAFDFPVGASAEAGHVHYVTFNPGSLEGASRIIVRYRVAARRGTRFIAQENGLPGAVSLYFQRAGDNWSARGAYDLYRWYAPRASVADLEPGEHQMVVSLDDPQWISVMGTYAPSNPQGFRAAMRNTSRVGLVFGSLNGSRGHGVFATAPARFELLSFDIE